MITEDASLAKSLDAALPYTAAEVVYAAREEMARTIEDVLSRRTRGYGDEWQMAQVASFDELAHRFYEVRDGKVAHLQAGDGKGLSV